MFTLKTVFIQAEWKSSHWKQFSAKLNENRISVYFIDPRNLNNAFKAVFWRILFSKRFLQDIRDQNPDFKNEVLVFLNFDDNFSRPLKNDFGGFFKPES